jgi:hypothetical protein
MTPGGGTWTSGSLLVDPHSEVTVPCSVQKSEACRSSGLCCSGEPWAISLGLPKLLPLAVEHQGAQHLFWLQIHTASD